MKHNIKSPLAFGVYDATPAFKAIEQHSCVCYVDDMGLVAVTGKAGDKESENYAEMFALAPEMIDALIQAESALFYADTEGMTEETAKDVAAAWVKVRELLEKFRPFLEVTK